MQIIFGDSVDLVKERFTVVELDTFQTGQPGQTITAWCVLNDIPLMELPAIPHLKKLHDDMIEQYKQQNFQFCLQAIEKLRGHWDGQLDTFYNDIEQRINVMIDCPPTQPLTWIRSLAAA